FFVIKNKEHGPFAFRESVTCRKGECRAYKTACMYMLVGLGYSIP
ncbi:MAG: hypothetical protein ACI86L_001523, partial [Dokdonia sp.]